MLATPPRRCIRQALEVVTLAVIYFGAAKLGLEFSFVQDNVTLVWPPSGVALAALLLFGPRLWPGLVLGAFAATASTGAPLGFALATAIGNPLATLCGYYLLRRVAGFDATLERPRDVLVLVLVAAADSSVSATIGAVGLGLHGMISWVDSPEVWHGWWLGDTMGILVLTPALTAWMSRPHLDDYRGRALEAAWLVIAMVLLTDVVFGDWAGIPPHAYPLQYLLFPLLVWSSFRFGPRGATTTTLVVVTLAMWHTVHGEGPFAHEETNQSLVLLWIFIAVVALQSLFIAAAVADRTRAQQALAANERRSRIIIDEVPALIAYMDADLRVGFINRTFADWHQVSADHCRGRPLVDLLDAEAWESYRPLLEQALTGREHTAEVRLRDRDGRERDLAITCVPHHDDGGVTHGVVQVVDDVTRRKDEERALSAAKDTAERMVRTKSLFLANMSHEIRTPLNGMIGMAALLRETEIDPEQRDYVDALRRSGDALLALVNDVLDFSKLEAGRVEIDHVDFDLHEAIDATLELMGESACRKGLALAALLDPEVPRRVVGDPNRLQQILCNLVGNAVKFTDVGEVAVRAGVSDARAGAVTLRIEVSDTGIGIGEEARAALFDAFAQADASTTRRFGGTGLGLAIVRALVGCLGGELGVASEPHRGSTFWFTLPLECSHDAPEAEPADLLAAARVLVVSASPLQRRALAQMLPRRAADVEAADTAEAALDRLRTACREGRAFDLVVLDHAPPELHGLALSRVIAADPELTATRRVLALPVGLRVADATLRTAGVDHTVTRPFRWTRLRRELAHALVSKDASAAPEARLAESSSSHPTSERTPALRVLLVEDNPVNQKVATRMLQKANYLVDVVANGKEALDAWSVNDYDLIVMDCQMPVMDGYEATAAIREREAVAGGHTPIVALTAHALDDDRERCLRVGMDDYLRKPVSTEELTTVVARWCRSSSNRMRS